MWPQVVYRPFLEDFLAAVIAGQSSSSSHSNSHSSLGTAGLRNASDVSQTAAATWVDVILDSLPPQHLDMGAAAAAAAACPASEHMFINIYSYREEG